MFVNIIEFPPIKRGKDEEFREWFAWSNSVYEKFNGFISRRLLKPTRGKKNYAAIVEHENEDTSWQCIRAKSARRHGRKWSRCLKGHLHLISIM